MRLIERRLYFCLFDFSRIAVVFIVSVVAILVVFVCVAGNAASFVLITIYLYNEVLNIDTYIDIERVV